ncbi:hypothetical protein KP190043_26800 [Klebsiella pneumoniae subsp. pneumoniae]|nr:hypothetical protein NUBL13790_42870 [Klebsiella pneumoniae]
MAHNRKSTKQKQFCNIAQWAGETGWGRDISESNRREQSQRTLSFRPVLTGPKRVKGGFLKHTV